MIGSWVFQMFILNVVLKCPTVQINKGQCHEALTDHSVVFPVYGVEKPRNSSPYVLFLVKVCCHMLNCFQKWPEGIKQEIWKLAELNRVVSSMFLQKRHLAKKLISPSKIMEFASPDNLTFRTLTHVRNWHLHLLFLCLRKKSSVQEEPSNLKVLDGMFQVLTKVGIESNRKYNKLFWSRHKGV